MNNLYIVLITIIFASCDCSNSRIRIINNSGEVLKNLEYGVDLNGLIKVDSLPNGLAHSSKIVFGEEILGDGAYILKFEKNQIHFLESFGYYTNGSSLNGAIIVTIEPDTIVFSYH